MSRSLKSPRVAARALSASRFAGYSAAAGVGGLANLAMVPVWLELFGADAYGRYAVTWAVAIACSAACAGWIRQAALRTSGTSVQMRDLPSWAILVAVALAGMSCAFLASLLGALKGAEVLAGGALASALVVGQLVTTVLQREDRAWAFAGSEVVKVVGTVAATLGIGSSLDLPGHLTLLLGLAIGHVLLIAFPGVISLSARHNSADLAVLRDWWQYGWPLSVWLTLAPVLLYADRMILQLFASPGLVGSFAAISDLLVRGIAAAAAPLVTAGHIRTMRWHNHGQHDEVAQAVRRSQVGLLVVTFVLVMITAVFQGTLVTLTGITALPWICIPLLTLGGGLWQVAMFTHKPLELAGRTTEMLVILVAAVLVQVLTCLALVPGHGAAGAAAGLVAGVGFYVAATAIRAGERRSRR